MAMGDDDFASVTPQLRRSPQARFGEAKGVAAPSHGVPMTENTEHVAGTEPLAGETADTMISSATLDLASPPLLSPSSSSSSLEELLKSPVHVSRRRCQSGEALLLDVNERLTASLVPRASQRSLASGQSQTRELSGSHGKARRKKRDHQPSLNSRRSRWLIPADHPYKIAWDLCTILLSFASAILTHQSIRDRSFQITPIWVLTQLWFVSDILLNFFTIKVLPDGTRVEHEKGVWARYLTTWFAVDVLSLVPWENMYVQPIIDRQKRRNLFVKSFFRTRAVIRVTRLLRGRHFRAFGRVARHTKHAGVGARRLLRLIIKYAPKYLLFYRNMKGILAVRLLRLVHWMRKLGKHLFPFAPSKLTECDEEINEEASKESPENLRAVRAMTLKPDLHLRRRVRALSSAFDRHETFDDITEQMS